MAKVITDYAEMTSEIVRKKSVIFDQDEKEYGRAVGYISSKGIYVYYKDINEFRFMNVFFTKEEIKDKFLSFDKEDSYELFDCPDFNPRKIIITKDAIILRKRKNGNDEIYRLDIENIKDRF